ncbi:ATP-binding cassette domain-containing protein [Klebsiella pneumoniae]|uniref:ATP-binding cassette domain-containing protein n=1 Tax=Klebsiella pneumoniae TaxID=573 RepID=UPI003974A7F5
MHALRHYAHCLPQSGFAEAGEHIAILGRTGCGKSTLLQLLTRAWDPSQGEILLNNQPLSGGNLQGNILQGRGGLLRIAEGDLLKR